MQTPESVLQNETYGILKYKRTPQFCPEDLTFFLLTVTKEFVINLLLRFQQTTEWKIKETKNRKKIPETC